MFKFSFFKMAIIFYISLTLSHIPDAIAADAQLKMVSTEQVVKELSRTESEQIVFAQLNRTEVQTELAKYGLNAEDAKKRVANLSDSELRNLASEMDQAQYGGSVAGILVVVVLVLLIIYLARRI